MTPNVREGLQYGAAIGMLVSGVALTFLSFFLNNYVVSVVCQSDIGLLWSNIRCKRLFQDKTRQL